MPGGTKLGRMYWELDADREGFDKGLAGAEKSAKDFSKKAGKHFDALSVAMGGLLAGGVAQLGAGIGKVVGYMSDAIAAGSDLAESQNKMKVVFGEAATSIEQWASGSASALAMTKQAALESVATFGNLFTSMGIGQKPAADMSQRLVELAADLASFNNLDPTVALEKLRSGIVGETEPLRALGVNLTAAAVTAKALEMGLAATADALTPANLAMARYELILEQTTAAQGDMARTSGGWANQQRILTAEMEDLKAKIGEQLLPVLTPFLEKLTTFVDQIAPDVIKDITDMTAALSAMVTVLTTADLGPATAQFADLKVAIDASWWAQAFGFIGQQIALTIMNFRELGFELSSIGEQFQAFGDFLKGDSSWSEYRGRMAELRTEYEAGHAAFQAAYDAIKNTDFSAAITQVTDMQAGAAAVNDTFNALSNTTKALAESATAAAPELTNLTAAWGEATQPDGLIGPMEKVIEGAKIGVDWSKLKPSGKDLVKGVTDGVEEAAKGAQDSMATFVDKNLKNAVAWPEVMKPAGRDAITGLLAGLEERKQDVLNFFKDLIQAAIDAAKASFTPPTPPPGGKVPPGNEGRHNIPGTVLPGAPAAMMRAMGQMGAVNMPSFAVNGLAAAPMGGGRSLAGDGPAPVSITNIIHMTSGQPELVRRAANEGTLEALRARGYR